MPWIENVSTDAATGLLKRIYDSAKNRAGHVADILRVSSLNPGALRSYMQLYRVVMFDDSPLSRAQREMLATVTAVASHCHY